MAWEELHVERAEQVCVCAGKVRVCVWEDKELPLMPKGGDYCRANTHTPFMIVVCLTVGLRFTVCAGSGSEVKELPCCSLRCTSVCTVISWKWILPEFLELPLCFFFHLLHYTFVPEVLGIFVLFCFAGKWFVLVVCHRGAAGTCCMWTQRFLSHLLLTRNRR